MEIKLNIGEMDTLVQLVPMTQSKGTQGEKIWTPGTPRSVFAKLEASVDETIGDGNLGADRVVVATIYKVPDLTTRWRVVASGQTFEIRSVDPISRVSPICQLTLNSLDP